VPPWSAVILSLLPATLPIDVQLHELRTPLLPYASDTVMESLKGATYTPCEVHVATGMYSLQSRLPT
jgi:hypothetical protein